MATADSLAAAFKKLNKVEKPNDSNVVQIRPLDGKTERCIEIPLGLKKYDTTSKGNFRFRNKRFDRIIQNGKTSK